MHARTHTRSHTPEGFVNGPHSEITGAALRSPRGGTGLKGGCLGHIHPAGPHAAELCGRSAAPGSPPPRPGKGGDKSAWSYRSWKEVGGGRPESAADLGQSPPCSGLSFPTRRLRRTVSIAALAPRGWSFPELGRTPSSARLPFPGPWPARSPSEPIPAAGATGAPGWP